MNLSKTEKILINALFILIVTLFGTWLYMENYFFWSIIACISGILLILGFNIYRSSLSEKLNLKQFLSVLSTVEPQIKSSVIDSFSPTLSELKLPYIESPSIGTNLDAVSTRKTYDIIKERIDKQRKAVESLRAYLSPKKQLALDEALLKYAKPQKGKVPSDEMVEYWGMDEETARKTAIERIEELLEFAR
jgi:hypothetical protein